MARQNYCPDFRAVLKADDHETKNLLVARARCKKWSCDYCAERNRRIWRARIINAVNELGGTWSFVTITAHPHWRGEAASLKNLRANIDKFQKRMVRKLKKQGGGAYVRVFEHHKDMSVHAHYIVQGQLDTQWIEDNAASCGMGWSSDSQALDHGGHVAAYITKYMTKDVGQFPPYVRRIVTSQKFPKLKCDATYKWRMSAAVFLENLTDAYARGGVVYDVDTREEIRYDYYLDHWVYPPEYDV